MADTPPMPPPKQLPLGNPNHNPNPNSTQMLTYSTPATHTIGNIYDQGIFKFQLLTSAFKPWEICGGLSMNHSPVSKQ
eukprot:1318198-Amorphochlora_amoeboformis.AAC.1